MTIRGAVPDRSSEWWCKCRTIRLYSSWHAQPVSKNALAFSVVLDEFGNRSSIEQFLAETCGFCQQSVLGPHKHAARVCFPPPIVIRHHGAFRPTDHVLYIVTSV